MQQQDCLRRFLFEQLGVRGEWVRLEQSWQQAKQYQHIVNTAVDSQLGQALVAVVLLAATIKFKGALIMQIQGSGELKALVAQCSHDRHIRGLVRSETEVNAQNLQQMIGEGGRLVITVESENSEPYQGIVAVQEDSLAEVLRSYFRQSEQLNTRLWLFANQTHAAGLFLQELPGNDQTEQTAEDWQRLELLANTLTAEELLTLDCETLLHRLFHEEPVRLYDAESVAFVCGCSRAKISNTLTGLGKVELETILAELEKISVDCQFCGAQYQFDRVDVAELFSKTIVENNVNRSTTQH